jgi:hypothetical protein
LSILLLILKAASELKGFLVFVLFYSDGRRRITEVKVKLFLKSFEKKCLHHEGKLSNLLRCSRPDSHVALLEQKICAFGVISISQLRLPAGTTNNFPSICREGTADPHSMQKLFVCLVEGRVNVLILSSPDIQLSLAVVENKFAA